MPNVETAQLIISARADVSGLDRFEKSVRSADEKSKELLKTIGKVVSASA